MERVVFARLAAIGVDQKGDLREGEKRDADRKSDARHGTASAGQGADGVDEKIGVFEIAEQQEISGDADGEHELAAVGDQPPADDIVEGNRGEDNGR